MDPQIQGTTKFTRGVHSRVKTSTEGRICSAEGCTTELSIYNRGTKCYAHSQLKYPRVRGATQANIRYDIKQPVVWM